MTDGKMELGAQAKQALAGNDWDKARELATLGLSDGGDRGSCLYVIAMLAWREGETDRAIDLFLQALQAQAPMEECGFGLASLLIEEQRFDDAVELLSALLGQMPDSRNLHLVYGELLLKMGRTAEAGEQVELLAELAPTWSSSLRLQGDWVMETKRDLDAAIGFYQMARALDPGDMGAIIGMAVAYQMKGEMADAARLLMDLESAGTRSVRLYRELGDLLLRLNNPPLALSACSKALELDVDDPSANYLAAELYMRLNRPLLARMHFGKTSELRPDWVAPRCGLARVNFALGEQGRAFDELDGLITAYPTENYPRLVKCAMLNDLGKFAEALEASKDYILGARDGLSLAFNRSMLQLRLGYFSEGWDAYRIRFRIGSVRRKPLTSPEWGGEDMTGQSLLVVWEQGLGDTLQFCRFVRLLKPRVGRVILGVQPELAKLLNSVEGADEVVGISAEASAAEIPKHDRHIYLMSLPHVLNIALDDLPVGVGYLKADPSRVAEWRDKLGSGAGLRVGLVWAGNPLHTNDARRSLKLEQMAPLNGLGRVSYFSILRGIDVQQLNAARDIWNMPDLGNTFRDFSDTAAVVELLDLVITVDTSVAHLCGALNKPVWLLVPFVSDWRWMTERSDSPWYPSMRIFRQPSPDDWASVMQSVRTALIEFTAEKTGQ